MPRQKNTIDIKGGKLFPFQFLVLGVLFLITGIGVVVPHAIIGSALILSAVTILTAHEGTEIMTSSNTYREYNSFLFVKMGKARNYTRVEKIFINPVRIRQKYYSAYTSSSGEYSHVEYYGYLKFSDGVKVLLVSDKRKRRIVKRLGSIASSLNIPLQDNTGAL